MKIVIDERETALYEQATPLLQQIANPSLTLEKRVLNLGDIIFTTDADETLLVIERKSFSDLLASIKDGRYTEQSYRLLGTYPVAHNIIYMLEGVMSSGTDRQKIISTITSLNVFKGFSVIRTTSLLETAYHIVYMADKIERDMKKGKNICGSGAGGVSTTSEPAPYCSVIKSAKKANITRENIGEIILCQIPGISSTTAVTLMQPFHTFAEFLDKVRAEPEYLNTIQIETNGKKRKLGTNIINSIQSLLY
jgi:ERCC4-type nuclease